MSIIVSVEPVCVEKQLLRLLSLVRFHPPSTNMNACSTCNDCVSTAKKGIKNACACRWPKPYHRHEMLPKECRFGFMDGIKRRKSARKKNAF